MYCLHLAFWVIVYCDLDLCPFDQKSNQHIYEPKYICDQNWAKFPSLVFETQCSQGFQDAQTLTDGYI